MAKAVEDLTLMDLQRLMRDRQAQLEGMLRRREGLLKQIADLDNRIAILEGKDGGAAAAAAMMKRRKKPAQRPKNDRPLISYIVEALNNSRNGLTLAELSAEVKKMGYQSHSTKFTNVVYQCIYNAKHVRHDETTGTYKVVSSD